MVPKAARSDLLKSIHNLHLGVNGCLNRARECLYWPGMSGEIRNYVSTCVESAESTNRVKGRKHSSATKHLVGRDSSFVAADLFKLNGKSYLVTTTLSPLKIRPS